MADTETEFGKSLARMRSARSRDRSFANVAFGRHQKMVGSDNFVRFNTEEMVNHDPSALHCNHIVEWA